MKLLSELIAGLEGKELYNEISRSSTSGPLAYDSRQVIPGSLFVCIRGFTDRRAFLYVREALARGALAVVSERLLATAGGYSRGIWCLIPVWHWPKWGPLFTAIQGAG
ncbi:MAG: hypothetical protein ACOX37_09490 [Bacillota bacterium]